MESSTHSIMLEHIAQEPVLIRELLDSRKKVTAEFCRVFQENQIRRVYFSGSGSPSNACEVLRFFCEQLLGVEASCLVPCVFNHHLDFNTRDYSPDEILLICPAESGRTKGTVIAAQHARELGIHTVCSTFNTAGILSKTCDITLFKPSGQEIALPSTKGHVIGIFLFLLCFVEASYSTGKIDIAQYESYVNSFYKVAEAMDSSQRAASNWFMKYQAEIMDSGSYWFIGYGANLGTARECALKFLECTRRPSFGYELEEFMHGPLCAVKATDMIFFLCAEDGAEKDRMCKLADFCKKITPRCVTVQSDADKSVCEMAMSIPATGNKMTSVLELLVPAQILSYHIACCLGFDLTQHSKNSAGKAMELSFPDPDTNLEVADE